MGKHSLEKEKKKIDIKKVFITALIVIMLVFGFNFTKLPKEEINDEVATSISADTTSEGKKLVIKSNSEYNRIVEYTFENNILKTVKIYEQFEEKERFELKKKNYEIVDNIVIISVNDEELSIEIEKLDFGSDTGMSYEQIYDKYLVKIVGAYEIL